MAFNIATTSDAGYSDTVSDFPCHVNKSLVTFPSAMSTKYFSNFFGTCEPSRSLSHELCFVFQSLSYQTPATHRTIDAVHSWIIDEGLNLSHLPRTGNFGMFMNEVFSHFHLQLVALYTSSDLWLNFLCFQFADFLCFCTRVQQRRKLITWRTSHKKFRLFSILHSSLRSHIVPLALAVVKSTAKPSRSPNLVVHDANFDGLNIAVASHAFNSFESMRRFRCWTSEMRSSWISHPLGSYEAVVQHATIQPFRGRWERKLEVLIVICE